MYIQEYGRVAKKRSELALLAICSPLVRGHNLLNTLSAILKMKNKYFLLKKLIVVWSHGLDGAFVVLGTADAEFIFKIQ